MNNLKEDILRKAMFQNGHIPPETSEELEEFDKIIPKKALPRLPSDLGNPMNIIKSGFKLKLQIKSDFIKKSTQMKYAMAAREGGLKIDEETLRKMKTDRDKAENKSD